MVDNEQQARMEAIDPNGAVLMAGRPTLLTSKLAAEFCQHIADGSPICTSANLVGVSDTAVRNWIRRGREEEGQGTKHAVFLAAFEKAQAESERFSVDVIRSAAGAGSWQASAWLLERSNNTRDRWKRPTERKEVSISTDVDGSEVADIEDQIREIAKSLT